MQTMFERNLSPIEQKILEEEKRYQNALKNDAFFEVLKEIRSRIKALKASLSHSNQDAMSEINDCEPV